MTSHSPPPFREHISPLLHADEEALAEAEVVYTKGHELSVDPLASAASFQTFVDKTRDGASIDAELEKLIVGTSSSGWPGCTAWALRDALDPAGEPAADARSASPQGHTLVLTTRRWLVVQREATARIVWQCALDDVAAAARAPRFLQPGRVRLSFSDSSWLTVASAGADPAKRLVAAWAAVRGVAPAPVPLPSHSDDDAGEPLSRYAARVSALLAQGEVPYAFERISYSAGVERIASDTAVEKNRTPLDTVADSVTSFVTGVGASSGLDAESLVGTTLSGTPGCQASAFRAALRINGTYLLATSQRWMVVSDIHSRPRVQWQGGIGDLTAVSHARKLGDWGRVTIVFADGSWVAVSAGRVSDNPAKRLVAAWRESRR